MKKCVWIAMLFAGLILCCAITVSAEGGYCGDNLSWTVENNVLTITGKGEMYDYTSNNSPWKELEISEIIIDEGVESIGEYAFFQCEKLKKISIPSSLLKINGNVFSNKNGAIDTYIADMEAWLNITFKLQTSNPLISGGSLYKNNKQVEEIIIPYSVTKIKKYTFFNYEKLKRIYFHSNITEFEKYAFTNCTADIYYEGTEEQWKNILRYDDLKERQKTFGYVMPVKTDVTYINKSVKMTVYGIKEAYVIGAYYNGGKMICCEYKKCTNGEKLTFNSDGDYNEIKLLTVDKLSNLQPICEAFLIGEDLIK